MTKSDKANRKGSDEISNCTPRRASQRKTRIVKKQMSLLSKPLSATLPTFSQSSPQRILLRALALYGSNKGAFPLRKED